MTTELGRAVRRCAAALTRSTHPGTYTAVIVSAEWDETNRLSVRVQPTGSEEIVSVNRLSTDVYALAAAPAPWGRLVLIHSIDGRLFASALIGEIP